MDKVKKSLPFKDFILSAFSGVGILFVKWLISFFEDKFQWEILSKYLDWIPIILAIILFGLLLYLNKKRLNRQSEDSYKKLQDNIDKKLEELGTETAYLEDNLAKAQYFNRKYEELEEYYKRIASFIYVGSAVGNSFIMEYLDKIEKIIADNTSEPEGSKINITLFEKKKDEKGTGYTIQLSNYHSKGTINSLRYNKNSFIGNVFKSKKEGYLPNIDARKKEDAFVDKDGRNYNTILGIPYVVDDECLVAVCITMEKANSLDNVYSQCIGLLKRYVQVIGLAVLLQKREEGDKDA